MESDRWPAEGRLVKPLRWALLTGSFEDLCSRNLSEIVNINF